MRDRHPRWLRCRRHDGDPRGDDRWELLDRICWIEGMRNDSRVALREILGSPHPGDDGAGRG
jgi:hypothetical protein